MHFSNSTPTAPKARSKRFLPIRQMLPLSVVASLVSGVALTGWLAFRSGQRAVAELVDTVSYEATANIEKQVTSYLLEPSMVGAVISAEVASGNINIYDTTELSQDLWQLTRSAITNTIYYGNEAGEFVYSRHEGDRGRIDLRDASTNFTRTPYRTDAEGNKTKPFTANEYDKADYNIYDHRKRGWYQKAAESKDATWSDVYRAKGNGALTITRATPVLTKEGQLEGIFGTNVYLSGLSSFLENLDLSPNARSFIIDNRTQNLIAVSTGQTLENSAATSSSDPLVQATARNLFENFSRFEQAEGQYAFTFELEDEKQLARVYRLQELGIDWLIGVTVPESDYMGDINASAKRTFIIGITITGVASLFALGAALNITKPISQLTQAAENIKNNQFDLEDLSEVIARPDEFSKLAILFNDMATVVTSREQSLAEQLARMKTEMDGAMDNTHHRQQLEEALLRAKQVRDTGNIA